MACNPLDDPDFDDGPDDDDTDEYLEVWSTLVPAIYYETDISQDDPAKY